MNNSFIQNLREYPKHLNANTFGSGLIAAIFGCTGPALIIIGGGTDNGLTPTQIISWLFAVYFFGGLLGFYLAIKFKQPIAGAYSIPGAVLVVGALEHFSLNEVSGAYLVAGIIVLLLGISGLIGKIMQWIPGPIVMAMITGAMIGFGTDMITSLEGAPIVAGAAILVYLLSTRFIKKVPPILISFVIAGFLAMFTGEFQTQNIDVNFVLPQFVFPTFSLDAMISVSIPLALLVIGAENAQSIGVLKSQGYKPPINSMTIWSGIGGIATSLFGGHNANIAGPMTAICASKESGDNLESRHASAATNGILFGAFGIIASLAVPFISAFPSTLIAAIAGLAMIGVILKSLQMSFSERKFQIGSFFSLVIAMSGVSFFNISSPFWSLIGGIIVSLVIEQVDFKEFKSYMESKEAS